MSAETATTLVNGLGTIAVAILSKAADPVGRHGSVDAGKSDRAERRAFRLGAANIVDLISFDIEQVAPINATCDGLVSGQDMGCLGQIPSAISGALGLRSGRASDGLLSVTVSIATRVQQSPIMGGKGRIAGHADTNCAGGSMGRDQGQCDARSVGKRPGRSGRSPSIPERRPFLHRLQYLR